VYGEIWKKEDAVVNVCSKAKNHLMPLG